MGAGIGDQLFTFTCSDSDQVSTAISDFRVVNQTTPTDVVFEFQFSKSDDDMVNVPNWGSCSIKSVPLQAKSNFNMPWEVVYRWDEESAGPLAYIVVSTAIQSRKLRVSNNFFSCSWQSVTSTWHMPDVGMLVDFDTVSL